MYPAGPELGAAGGGQRPALFGELLPVMEVGKRTSMDWRSTPSSIVMTPPMQVSGSNTSSTLSMPKEEPSVQEWSTRSISR